MPDTQYLSDVDTIVEIQHGLSDFWSKAEGWAPESAATLLSSSRLDWVASLAESLRRWDQDGLSDGDLILAWVNLGSLVEGTLKIFLAAYYEDYLNDSATLIALGIKHHKGSKAGQPKNPDILTIDPILKFFKKKDLLSSADHDFISIVQSQRNLIHAFVDKPLRPSNEFRAAVATYKIVLSKIAVQLPYPEGHGFSFFDKALSTLRHAQGK